MLLPSLRAVSRFNIKFTELGDSYSKISGDLSVMLYKDAVLGKHPGLDSV